MDLLEFVEQQVKKGKSVQEVRELLVNNGYPLYEVDNALAVAEEHVDSKRTAGAGLAGGSGGDAEVQVNLIQKAKCFHVFFIF